MSSGQPVPDSLLTELFPFHLWLDPQLRITHAGPSLRKVIGAESSSPRALDQDFALRSPDGPLTYEHLRANSGALLVLEHQATGTWFRGQVLTSDGGDLLLVVSPWITRSDQIRELGLRVGDFAVHDPVLDVLHLLESSRQALRDARVPNQRLERFFDLSPDLFCVVGFDGRFRLLNPAWSRLLGYPASELLRTPVADLIHPEDLPVAAEARSSFLGGADDITAEIRLRTQDGTWIPVRWRSTADLDAQVAYVSGRDARAEEEVREVSAAIVAAASSGMVLVDRTGRIVLANAHAEQLFRYESGELIGRGIEELVPVDLRDAHRALRVNFLATPQSRPMAPTRDLVGVTKDGATIPLEVALGALTIAGGEHALAVISDISARKEFEAELSKARDSALELARAKSDFLANTSHEIRTPLNAIIGMSALLIDTPLDDQQTQYARTVHSAGETLLALINDVLDFSKMEVGKLQLEDVALDPRELIDQAVRVVDTMARDRGLECIVAVEASVPAALRGDPGRLRQVLTNLLHNAVKFTVAGSVTVKAGYSDGTFTVHVIDTGPGVPADARETLFHAFTQADTSITRRFGGTGLGLSISSGLVTLMGGELAVDCPDTGGSDFSFAIPMEVASDQSHQLLQGWHVAVVASDTTIRAALRRALEAAGASVTDRVSSVDALVSDLPDVVLEQLSASLRAGVPIVRVTMGQETTQYRRVEWPPAEGALTAAIAGAQAPAPQTERASRAAQVLVVEDNEINQRVTVAMLHKLGHETHVVADGRQALDAMADRPFDVVLMDCQMPGMDGFTATRTWRERETTGHLPVIALTANAMDGDEERCLAAGMDAYLSKPVRIEALRQVIDTYMHSDGVTPSPQRGAATTTEGSTERP